MADVTPTPVPAETVVTPVSTTIDAALVTAGVVLTPRPDPGRLFMRVVNTTAGALDLTVTAGDRPPSLGAADLVFEIPGGSAPRLIGPLDSGKIMQNDGTVLVGFETGFTGTIEVYEIARNA